MARVAHIRRLRRDEGGSTLVEFAIALALFLLIFFIAIDFGRMMYQYTSIEKALQMAARIATVRPPVCSGVPSGNIARVSGSTARFGTLCRVGGVCQSWTEATCTAQNREQNPEIIDQIWDRIEPLLPPNMTEGNLHFRYEFDPNLGFLGGPQTPMVTVSLGPNVGRDGTSEEEFTFMPISAVRFLPGLLTGTNFAEGGIQVRKLSVSLPGEDLNVGNGG